MQQPCHNTVKVYLIPKEIFKQYLNFRKIVNESIFDWLKRYYPRPAQQELEFLQDHLKT